MGQYGDSWNRGVTERGGVGGVGGSGELARRSVVNHGEQFVWELFDFAASVLDLLSCSAGFEVEKGFFGGGPQFDLFVDSGDVHAILFGSVAGSGGLDPVWDYLGFGGGGDCAGGGVAAAGHVVDDGDLSGDGLVGIGLFVSTGGGVEPRGDFIFIGRRSFLFGGGDLLPMAQLTVSSCDLAFICSGRGGLSIYGRTGSGSWVKGILRALQPGVGLVDSGR